MRSSWIDEWENCVNITGLKNTANEIEPGTEDKPGFVCM